MLSFNFKKGVLLAVLFVSNFNILSIRVEGIVKKEEKRQAEQDGSRVDDPADISMVEYLQKTDIEGFVEEFCHFLNEAQGQAEKVARVKNFLHAIITSKKYDDEQERKSTVKMVVNLVGVYLGDYFKKGIMDCVVDNAYVEAAPCQICCCGGEEGFVDEEDFLPGAGPENFLGDDIENEFAKKGYDNYDSNRVRSPILTLARGIERLPVALELQRKRLSSQESFDIVKFCIESGVNVHIRDDFGKNLLDYLRELECDESERKEKILSMIQKRSDEAYVLKDIKERASFLQNNDEVKKDNGDFKINMPSEKIVVPRLFFLCEGNGSNMAQKVAPKFGGMTYRKTMAIKRKRAYQVERSYPGRKGGRKLDNRGHLEIIEEEKGDAAKYNLADLLFLGEKDKFLHSFVGWFKKGISKGIVGTLLHGIILSKEYNDKEKMDTVKLTLSLLECFVGEQFKKKFIDSLCGVSYAGEYITITPLDLALKCQLFDIARLFIAEGADS